MPGTLHPRVGVFSRLFYGDSIRCIASTPATKQFDHNIFIDKMDKYGRTYHLPFSPGATSDDKILHEWQDLLACPDLVLTEKLDGENTCLKREGVFARSHAAPTRSPWAANVRELWQRLRRDLGDWQIFGENLYGIHSIEYERLQHHFFVFAVRLQGHWLAWDQVVEIAEMLELPTAPVRERGVFTEKSLQAAIQEGLDWGSAWGGACEGFVLRNAEGFPAEDFYKNVLKYVRANHVQTDEHWTRNWRRAALWLERLV